VEPLFIPKAEIENPTCADVGCCHPAAYGELKVDPPAEGSYSIGGGDYIYVSGFVYNTAGDLISFTWSSDKPVYCVIVKGGAEGTNVYCYGATGSTGPDSGLSTPGEYNISHIVFCYDPATTTTTQGTTTTTDPGTTTTTRITTTTTQGTTTTTQGTTTTTQGTTTTTQGTTTTTQGTTTTTQGTTTTTQGTTTTTQGTTTTTQGTTTTTGGTTTTTLGTTTTSVDTTTTTKKKPTTTTTGTIEVLALTGYNSLWYVAGSLLIAMGIVIGTFSLSTALKRR
jgi:hypothetical protein